MVETQNNNFENQHEMIPDEVNFTDTQTALEDANHDFELKREQEKLVKKFEKMQGLSNLVNSINEGMQ